MHPSDDLLRYFQELAARGGRVRLLNTYRGIPIIHPAVVLSVNQGYVVVEIHPHQAVCLNLESSTFLVSDQVAQTLKARVVAVEMLRNQAILAEFRRTDSTIGKRLSVRVQPDTPVDVVIYDGENRVDAKLADLSSMGMGVTELNTHIFNQVDWKPGQGVYVDVKLSQSGEPVRVKGKVTNRIPSQGMPLERVGITIQPDLPARDAFGDYIAARQVETLEELNRVHETMSRRQGSAQDVRQQTM